MTLFYAIQNMLSNSQIVDGGKQFHSVDKDDVVQFIHTP